MPYPYDSYDDIPDSIFDFVDSWFDNQESSPSIQDKVYNRKIFKQRSLKSRNQRRLRNS